MGDLIYHEPAAENVVMQGGFGYVNNELLVTLDSSDSLSTLKDYLRTIGGEVVGEIPVTADYQILLPAAQTQEELEQMIEQLKALPYVRRSSLNYAFELENNAISGSSAYYPNDKKWDDWSGNSGNNWNMKAIDAPGAWVYHDQMQPVNVGIIEELFDPYHEDLSFEEMPFGNISAMGPYKYNGLGWWTSKQSHGTHVAGIIGATFDNGKGVCGVAPNAKLYGANWKNGDGGKFYYTQKAALGYLVQKKHCRVLNLSFSIGGYGLRYSASQGGKKAQENFNILNADLTEFLDDLEKNTGNSFLICKSADNDNDKLFYKKDKEDVKNGIEYFWQGDYKKDPDYNKYKNRFKKDKWVSGGADAKWDIYSGIENPEVKDSIIVVGATAVSGMHSYFGCKHNGYQIASYSNRGTRVDVLAPGGSDSDNVFPDAKIYSTVADGAVGYGYKVGTSMATPHVAGVAAMILGIDPTFTAKEVKDIIKSTATGSYGEEGYKMLNAKLAVEKATELRNQKAKKEENSSDDPTERYKYEIFRETLTWEEAKAACEAKGGHLATITSQEEQKMIESLNTQNNKLWIGGYKNSAGQWCWVTGELWKYQNWGDGEPNNSSNVVADESCVAVWPSKWNDLANSNTYEQSGYVCEWETSDAAEETQVKGYTGHLYEFYTLPESEWESGPITWQQAERRCEWKGGHLAVIESSTENFLLYSAMKAKGYENAYFGYSDKSSEGNWKWINGTSTAYTNWHSGEPNNQDGIEHYAMFYEKFQDGTWNDADGIIDAGCAYICEWDDPTDKISQGDSFTDQQLRIIAKDLGVPDDLNVEIRQSPKAYWEAAGLWDIYVEITHNGKLVASGSFDVETGEMGRNIYIYTPI